VDGRLQSFFALAFLPADLERFAHPRDRFQGGLKHVPTPMAIR
jgi:hypothetical protein